MEVHVSDQEWEFISQHLSHLPPPQHPGRPRASERGLFDGILWVLVTGSRWSELPKDYPAKSSCHRRFQQWSTDGSWVRLRKALTRRLHQRKKLKLSEGFIDGSFIKAKKGVPKLPTQVISKAKKVH